jgi:hypothetical protein
MTIRRLLAGALLIAMPVLAQEGKWQSLFDGVSSKGWVEVTGKPFPAQSWKIEDGCLKSLVKGDGFQDIRTVEKYRSFELEFEWKIAKDGNSGVKYLIQKVDEWTNKEGRQARARGLEYQLVDRDSADAKDPTRYSASLYSVLAAPEALREKLKEKIGGFNQSRLIVNGDHVEHWLNGVKAVSFSLDEPKVQAALRNLMGKNAAPDAPIARESWISLQNHSSEVWFRNLRIRRLP